MRELDVNQAVIKDNQAKLSPIAHAVRLSIVGLGLAHGASQAATIEVTSNLDDQGGACTLRQAIVSLNEADLQGGCLIDSGSFGANDSIMFSNSLPSNSINLIGQYDNYYSPLNILSGRDISIGAGNIDGGITVVAGSFDPSNPTDSNTSRIFEVEYATLRLDNITVTGANSRKDGAAIWLSHSIFSMNNSTVSGNTTSTVRNRTGGGIFAENSTLSLINSAVSSNEAGGGLFVTGSSISLINSTISDNFREGLSVTGSDVEIINSTFSNNVLNFYSSNVTVRNSRFSSSKLYVVESSSLNLVMSTVSGVLASDLSVVNVIDSTVSGNGFELFNSTLGLSNSTVSNTSAFEGGFVAAFSSKVTIHNSTVTNTTASFNSGSIWAISTSFNLSNSIIANSYVMGAEDNQLYLNGGSFVSDSVSIVEGGGGLGGSRDFDPGLLPLANNGGPTQTHALAPDSIAIDAGIIGTCTLRDQRGRKRDGGDSLCDVGAFESIKDSFLPPIYLLLLGDDQGS